MALYINDKYIVENISINYILEFFTKENHIKIEKRENNLLILFPVHRMRYDQQAEKQYLYTNTITINRQDKIMINPFSNEDGENITIDIYNHIINFTSKRRNRMLSDILQ